MCLKTGAVEGKRHGRVLSLTHPPVSIFWYSSSHHGNRKKVCVCVLSNCMIDHYIILKDDEDYDPVVDSDSEEEGAEFQEGVEEGAESVLIENRAMIEDDYTMDTIARSVSHPYYLRSLHQPEEG